MAYSDFTLTKIKKNFSLNIVEEVDIFASFPPLECGVLLREILQANTSLALAINTEKARSEMLISPVLIDFRRQLKPLVSLFSGIEFNVDSSLGLNGVCDFLLGLSSEQLFLSTPVVIVVEAKKENLNNGIGQCAAEMMAAQLFNEQEGNSIRTILGTVTTGDKWKFLQLQGNNLVIDLTEYYLQNINQILGILAQAVQVNQHDSKTLLSPPRSDPF